MQAKEFNIRKIGIIAGSGDLPLNIISYCLSSDIEFFVILIDPSSIEKYLQFPHQIITIGQVGKIIQKLQEEHVCEVVLAGGVAKPSFGDLKLDSMGTQLLAKITKNKLFGDNSILSVVVKFIEDQGLIVKGADYYVTDNMADYGNLTKAKPSDLELEDINLGKKIAHLIGGLDIGQAVIIDEGVVLGVEAIEGTASLIARCANYKLSKNRSGILIKTKKPDQEQKIDLPSIGTDTVRQIHEANFRGIALEAKNSIIIDKAKVIELANNLDIFIIGI